MILDDIVEKRKEQLQREKDNIEPQDMKEMALNSKNKNHGFKEALKKSGLSVISEVKKASPSKGVIAEDFAQWRQPLPMKMQGQRLFPA